ncbi:MAG: HAMP domain-containing histidine kinase [Ruminococcaceae bacterium]|nr:HAMP domain-containing histidine kinase [Oscillospiraceae bacterium]
MFKSVFSKYFTISTVLVITAMVALGLVQLFFFNGYWIAEKREQLTENARQIAHHTADVTSRVPNTDNTYVISTRSIKPTVELLAQGLDAEILITDTAGEVLLISENTALDSRRIPESALSQMEAEYFNVSSMDGFFPTVHYTAATPITIKDGVHIGYVITAMPADGLFQYLNDTMRTYLMSALVVLLVSFIVIYVMVYRMVRPLREMAEATRRFAEGDFTYRLKVRGKDEVAELANALNNMAVSLSATENMSRSFIANVSHELKTPMTTISGFVDGMLDGTIPPERQEHYLRIVSDEVRRLSRLVKSMLDLSRIDNGTVALKPVSFDLTDAVCSALLSFEQRIEEKRVSIEGLPECDRVTVTADFDLVGQVVYNLLDNAVKFVNEGGVITVRTYRENGKVWCSIRNSGAGLSAEEMPRVFERFYKTDRSRSLDKTGVGLGLFIVKTVITLHKGEIFVRSVEGDYCEFVFWLPDEGEKHNK